MVLIDRMDKSIVWDVFMDRWIGCLAWMAWIDRVDELNGWDIVMGWMNVYKEWNG